MRPNNSLAVKSDHCSMKESPTSAGAIPSPRRSSRWHMLHRLVYCSLPRVACWALKTPFHTVLFASWAEEAINAIPAIKKIVRPNLIIGTLDGLLDFPFGNAVILYRFRHLGRWPS